MIKKKTIEKGKEYLARAPSPTSLLNASMNRRGSELYERLHKDSEQIKADKEKLA